MHRLGLFLTALLTLIGLSTASAVAHEEINPKSAVVGQPTFFQLSAANEKKAGLTKITLHAPDGLPFGATTRSPNGWHAEVSETTITWSGGTVAPDQFDSWGFEIEGADQAKTYTYKADLGFADGTTDSVDVPITAVASAATPPTSTETAPKTATKPSDGTARVVAGIALLLSLVALGLALARRSGGAAQTSGDGAGSEASADW